MPAPQTPAEMEAIMVKNLPERYGKTLDQWIEVCAAAGLEKKMEFVQFLKQEHGVKHGEAYVLTQIYFNGGKLVYGNPEALLQEQYKKEEQRELYDFLSLQITKSFTEPIKLGICKGYVSVLGHKQFAVILPKRGGIWIGLALGDEPTNELLKTAKNIGGTDKINRYIAIEDEGDWSEQTAHYLEKAYRFNS
ncbi:DUF4287 domain-containing protein [Cryomorphaceae bacterium]|nr:DUF4287 domain-containing protein [Cryomorphaceae bacterium]